MRKTVFVCDRCGAEIDGLPAMIEVQTIREATIKDLEPVTELADVEELASSLYQVSELFSIKVQKGGCECTEFTQVSEMPKALLITKYLNRPVSPNRHFRSGKGERIRRRSTS